MSIFYTCPQGRRVSPLGSRPSLQCPDLLAKLPGWWCSRARWTGSPYLLSGTHARLTSVSFHERHVRMVKKIILLIPSWWRPYLVDDPRILISYWVLCQAWKVHQRKIKDCKGRKIIFNVNRHKTGITTRSRRLFFYFFKVVRSFIRVPRSAHSHSPHDL